jgi:triosephosphate isomerase
MNPKNTRYRCLSFFLSLTLISSQIISLVPASELNTMLAPLHTGIAELSPLPEIQLRKDIPPLSQTVEELLQNFSDIVIVNDKGVRIVKDLEDNYRLYDLHRELVENPNIEVQDAAFFIASAITNARGVKIDSTHKLFKNWSKIEDKFTVPAENQRFAGILQGVSFFKMLKKLNALGIAELAGSEKTYSGLDTLKKFTGAMQLAAAFAGYTGPILMQADHRQQKPEDIFKLDETKNPGQTEDEKKAFQKKFNEEMTLDEREPYVDITHREKAREKYQKELLEGLSLGQWNIDIDSSTLVDPVLLARLYNEKGLAPTIALAKKMLDEGQSMEAVSQYFRELPLSDLEGMMQQDRVEQYKVIHKHAAEETVRHIVRIRNVEMQMQKEGRMPVGFHSMIGNEERHIDLEFLKDKPSEPEGMIALMELIQKGLERENASFKEKWNVDLTELGPVKAAYQNETAHGVAGRVANIVVFVIMNRTKGLHGVDVSVQHGASKLTVEQFPNLPKNGIGEVHLATQLQNTGFEVVSADPAMVPVVWDLMQLMMKPEMALTPVTQNYLKAVDKTETWLRDYIQLQKKNTVKFGEKKKEKPSTWDAYLAVLKEKKNLDPQNPADLSQIVNMMLGDDPNVPEKARSTLKDLVKYLNFPLMPYCNRMRIETIQATDARMTAWREPVYTGLNSLRSLDKAKPYLTEDVAPLPQRPATLKNTAPLDIAKALSPNYEAFSVADYADLAGVTPEAAEATLKTLLEENDDIDTLRTEGNEILYVYSPIAQAVQLAPDATPESFPTDVPRRVIIGHSEVRDYLNMTTKQVKEQLDAFLTAGFKVILPWGDFPVTLAGKNYLESKQRIIPDNEQEFEKLFNSYKRDVKLPNFSVINGMLFDVRAMFPSVSDKSTPISNPKNAFHDIYQMALLNFQAEIQKKVNEIMLGDQFQAGTQNAAANEQELLSYIIRALAGERAYAPFIDTKKVRKQDSETFVWEQSSFGQALFNALKEPDALLTAEKIAAILAEGILSDNPSELRKKAFKELATIHEIRAQLRVLYDGLDISKLGPLLKSAYEPVEAIRTVAIPRPLAELRQKKILNFLGQGLPKGFNSPLIYGGGANEKNIKEVLATWGGAFIGKAGQTPETAVQILEEAQKSEGRPQIIFNMKAARTGPFADYYGLYKGKGIDLKKEVKVTHGVSMLDAQMAFLELQGRRDDFFTNGWIERSIVLGHGDATNEAGQYTANIPASVLARIGVTHAIVENKNCGPNYPIQIENLSTVGISGRLFDPTTMDPPEYLTPVSLLRRVIAMEKGIDVTIKRSPYILAKPSLPISNNGTLEAA